MKMNLFLIAVAAITLSGCTGQENSEAAGEKSAVSEIRSLGMEVPAETDGIPGEHKIHAQEVDHAQPVSDPSVYEELEHTEAHFTPEDYEIRVANDNPGNRVLLFMDGEKPAYKTVLIKNQGLLKIISGDEGLIEETKI